MTRMTLRGAQGFADGAAAALRREGVRRWRRAPRPRRRSRHLGLQMRAGDARRRGARLGLPPGDAARRRRRGRAGAGRLVARARRRGGRTLRPRCRRRATAIVAVCCSTQGEGTVCVDRDGKAIGRALTWLDMRGEAAIGERAGGRFRVAGYGPLALWRWLRLTGGAPALSGKDSAGHIAYLKRARAGALRARLQAPQRPRLPQPAALRALRRHARFDPHRLGHRQPPRRDALRPAA